MQDSGLGKEAVKALKHHDNFLTEMRLLVEKDQDSLRQDIDDKIQLAQIVRVTNKDHEGRWRYTKEEGLYC